MAMCVCFIAVSSILIRSVGSDIYVGVYTRAEPRDGERDRLPLRARKSAREPARGGIPANPG